MDRAPPAGTAGLVVIRAWIESPSEGADDDALRARITTARDPHLGNEETFTVVGSARVLAVVRAFLGELAGGEPP
jgi:hypothetical protein